MRKVFRGTLVKQLVAGPVVVAQAVAPLAGAMAPAAISATALTWTSRAALAQVPCAQIGAGGFGPPSISVAEASTTEVLEQIRRRQLRAMQPAAFSEAAPEEVPTAEAPEAEVPAAEAPAEEAPVAEAVPPTAKKKKAKAKVTAPQPKAYYEPKAIYEPKAFGEPMAIATGGKDKGVWARGFIDWNRHSNLAPGQQENPTRRELTGGGMAGMDVTHRISSREGLQIGALVGYSGTHDEFSDTSFIDENTPDRNKYRRTGHEQDIDGPFVGAYLAYFKNKWLSDLAFKVDFLDLSQKSTLELFGNNGTDTGCPSPHLFGAERGSSSLTSYTVAGNTQYRIPINEYQWYAPTAGFRYTNTDFGSDSTVTDFPPPGDPFVTKFGNLGLEDGQALRLQGGFRFGGTWLGSNGLWETEFAALAYSDVWVDGFSFTSTSGGTVSPVDEGKLRGLGQFTTQFRTRDGMSYMLRGEVYGGEDLIGVSGQAGARYEW